MFTHVRRIERKVASVRGVSSLYNMVAYKRLFPRAPDRWIERGTQWPTDSSGER